MEGMILERQVAYLLDLIVLAETVELSRNGQQLYGMLVSQIINDTFIDQKMIDDWEYVRSYTLASCSLYVAFIGGFDTQNSPSTQIKVYCVHDLTKRVFAETSQLTNGRVSPACVFDRDNKVLYVYGGFGLNGEFINIVEMITLGSHNGPGTFIVDVGLNLQVNELSRFKLYLQEGDMGLCIVHSKNMRDDIEPDNPSAKNDLNDAFW